MEQMKTLTLSGNSYEIVDKYARDAILALQEGGSGNSPVSANFSVVAYPTDDQLTQSAPADNTIGVITDTPITKSILSPNAPTNPVEGMAWIQTSETGREIITLKAAASVFNVVYASQAYQYIEGEWVKKTAKSYHNGEWIEWIPNGAVYWHGNECTDITGGWTSKAWKLQSDAGTTAQTFNIDRNPDHLMFTKTGLIGAVMYATNPIDLTNVKAIHFKGEMLGAGNAHWCAFHVWTKMSGSYWATNSVATVKAGNSGAMTSFTLDVSALSGSHYLGFGIYDPRNYVKLEELFLEVI